MSILRLVFVGMICCGTANAQGPAQPGASFLKTFAGLCVRHMADFEVLRIDLKAKGFPMLQEMAARAFLDGRPGDVWPIPESGVLGNMVLLLPSDRTECSVLARRGPISQTEAEFRQLAISPPPAITSEMKTDEQLTTLPNGAIHTIGYLWRAQGNPKAVALFLTSAPSPNASLQLKATVSKVDSP